MCDILVEIRKKSVLNEANETANQPKEKIMRVLNLSVGLRVTEVCISLLSDTDCNEERAAATGQRIMRIFAFMV
jgi:hypothetical protein